MTTLEQVVSRFPIVTTLLLETANVGQMVRMWTGHTAEGQSLTSWVLVNIALWLWFIFFRVKTPNEKWAIRCQALGIMLNAGVVLTVIYWRFLAK